MAMQAASACDARTGYAGWAATYEDTVQDAMDLETLEPLDVDWAAARTVADLACGTGRTGAWLKQRGAGEIDGVDLTPEMLALARERGVHRSLREGRRGMGPELSIYFRDARAAPGRRGGWRRSTCRS